MATQNLPPSYQEATGLNPDPPPYSQPVDSVVIPSLDPVIIEYDNYQDQLKDHTSFIMGFTVCCVLGLPGMFILLCFQPFKNTINGVLSGLGFFIFWSALVINFEENVADNTWFHVYISIGLFLALFGMVRHAIM